MLHAVHQGHAGWCAPTAVGGCSLLIGWLGFASTSGKWRVGGGLTIFGGGAGTPIREECPLPNPDEGAGTRPLTRLGMAVTRTWRKIIKHKSNVFLLYVKRQNQGSRVFIA